MAGQSDAAVRSCAMKRIPVLVICGLMTAGVAGCGRTDEIRVNGVRLEAETFHSEPDSQTDPAGEDPEGMIAVYIIFLQVPGFGMRSKLPADLHRMRIHSGLIRQDTCRMPRCSRYIHARRQHR